MDIWSVGLVFAEIILRVPYIAGDSDPHQLTLICLAVGTPTEENWPGVSKLDLYTVSQPQTPVRGRDHYMSTFGGVGADGVDLLMRMLALDPRKRVTARQVLEHPWWSKDPKPTNKQDLPTKRGGEAALVADLKRRPGIIDGDRAGKVARKLDFGAAR